MCLLIYFACWCLYIFYCVHCTALSRPLCYVFLSCCISLGSLLRILLINCMVCIRQDILTLKFHKSVIQLCCTVVSQFVEFSRMIKT